MTKNPSKEKISLNIWQKSIFFLFLFFALSLITNKVQAATYYVDAVNGNDASVGNIQTSPIKTITAVNKKALLAGDTVLFKAGQTWQTQGSLVPKSGTMNAYITYGTYGTGAKPKLNNIILKDKSYIKFQGLEFYNNAPGNWIVYIDSSDHIVLEGCNMIAGPLNTGYAVLTIRENSEYNVVRGCFIEHKNLVAQNDAVNLKHNANYNLIENNIIGTATHYALTIMGSTEDEVKTNPDGSKYTIPYSKYTASYNIIRNNKINNPQGAMVEIQSNANRNVFEGNEVSGGKSTANNNSSPQTVKSVSQYNILRNNIIHSNISDRAAGISSVVYRNGVAPANNYLHNRTYNNVINNIKASPLVIGNDEPAECNADDNVYKNNIVFANPTVDGIQVTVTPYVASPNYFFINNIIYNGSESGNVFKIKGVTRNVAAQQTADGAHFSGNIQKDPGLDLFYKPKVSSPAIDKGIYLTKITSASGNGTKFYVEDPNYFTDGFGITLGDKIQVGKDIVRIKKVDYNNKLLEVDMNIYWIQGSTVSKPYLGNAPDIGVYESDIVVPETCTSFNYSNWGTCVNGRQTRNVTSSYPANCTGGNPVLTQNCTVIPTCTSWTYSAWSTCVNSIQTRSVVSSFPLNCSGGNPILSQSCQVAPVCTNLSFKLGYTLQSTVAPNSTYKISCDYGAIVDSINAKNDIALCSWTGWNGTAAIFICNSGSVGTRINRCTVAGGTASNSCVQTNIIGSTNVVAPPPVCTSWTYSNWGSCIGGQQTRTALYSFPLNCVNGAPILSQSCQMPVVDSDKDGMSDIYENALGTDRYDADMDNDGYGDKEEILNGYDPFGPGKINYNSQLTKEYSGEIILKVQAEGQMWYVNPSDKRYFISGPSDLLYAIRKLGRAVRHNVISNYSNYYSIYGGKFLIDVDDGSRMYYFNPINRKLYYIADATSGFNLLKSFGQGMSNANLWKIRAGFLY
ncbi:MAG: hypothetical protein US81_C0014G0008 [Parcubacteria group bacterium GW2011_GWE2_38_18]|nr:MAG: hypothetical protein US81_C0014G0008 [Parcubacteria group bacterium GW2011_GWE2_38_18]